MAEEMAEAIASNESKQAGRSTANSNKTARKREPGKAQEPVPLAPETKDDSRGEKAPDSTEPKCQSAASGFSYRESLHEAVGKRFKEIINGLIKIIDQGNPAGAKVLFDALAKLQADPDKVEHQSEVGMILSDLLGPDFEWNKAQQEDEHDKTETAEAGIDAGSIGREPE
jgi:hypothetical protein